jgi:hypothetical protein
VSSCSGDESRSKATLRNIFDLGSDSLILQTP